VRTAESPPGAWLADGRRPELSKPLSASSSPLPLSEMDVGSQAVGEAVRTQRDSNSKWEPHKKFNCGAAWR